LITAKLLNAHLLFKNPKKVTFIKAMDDLHSENLQKNPTTIELSKDESSQLHILARPFLSMLKRYKFTIAARLPPIL
jgi:hypothetical protein